MQRTWDPMTLIGITRLNIQVGYLFTLHSFDTDPLQVRFSSACHCVFSHCPEASEIVQQTMVSRFVFLLQPIASYIYLP
jgi:hypothetical protein